MAFPADSRNFGRSTTRSRAGSGTGNTCRKARYFWTSTGETPTTTRARGVKLWLSEATLGGSGAVEALARTTTEDPRSIIRALEAAVAPGEVELTARSLEEFDRSLRLKTSK